MGVRNISVLITGDAKPLRAVLQDAAGEVDRFAAKAEQSSGRSAKATTAAAAGIAAGVYLVVDGIKALGAASVEFDANLRSINTIAGLSEAALQSTGDALLELSTVVPKTAADVSSALYDVTSSGFAGADALHIVDISARAATAGLTTTANSAKAIDAVLNAYGRSAEDAAAVSDVLFQTVNVGVLDFEDLTGIIGDTVGAAAAAKIPIEDLGAAIATLTLSGISPSEAGTSVSRLIDSLIAPSEQLAKLYQTLGYESGEVALKTKGLAGVMEDIRVATGGNVTALLGLFPEVRAARGAFSLMANDGTTYARAMDQVADATATTGATSRAFEEQMKSTRAQFQLTVNGLQADAIRMGLKILPVFNDLLKVARDLGGDASTQLERGFHAVQPTLESLYRSGVNVVEVVTALYRAAEPVAGVLLDIGGSAVLAGLAGVAAALEAVTGFLADHPDLVTLVAAAYLATLVPSLAAATIAFNRLILTPVVLFLNNTLIAAGGASAALKGLAASAASLAAIALPIYAAVQAFTAYSSAVQGAKQQTDALAGAADTSSLDGALKSIDDLSGKMQALQARDAEFSKGPAIERWGYQVGQAFQQMAGGKNDILENSKSLKATADAISEIADKARNVQTNLKDVASTTGLSTKALEELARTGKVDLTGAFADSTEERQKLVTDVQALQAKTGLAGDAFGKAFGQVAPEALQKTADAIGKLQEDTSKAFAGAFDVVSKFDPTGGVSDSAVEQAAKKVADARQRVADATDRAASAKRGASKAQEQAISRAQEQLSRAQEDQAKLGSRRASANLATFYRDSIAKGTRFTRELNTAIGRGLDPAVVSRLLTAGPEQALPILDALAADRKGSLIKLVNAGERELSRLNQIAVEQARLTALAVNSSTDQMATDLATAIQISQAKITEGGRATAQNLAKSLRLPQSEIQRIADEFGITLVDAVQAAVAKRPIKFRAGTGVPTNVRPDIPTMATGGAVPANLGTPGQDSVHALLMPREYVHPVASVDYYGVQFMEAIRTRRLPKFADGGQVASSSIGGPSYQYAASTRPGAATIVRVPVTETNTVQAPMQVRIDRLVTQDASTFRQWGRGHGGDYGHRGFGGGA